MSGIVNDNPIASSRQSITFATGTKMIFNQTAAPTGWTKVTGIDDDQALRVTTGTVGTGGSVAFETAFASVTPTITAGNAAWTITEAQIGNHTHSIWPTMWEDVSGSYCPNSRFNNDGSSSGGGGSQLQAGTTGGSSGSGSSHTHVNSPSSSAIDLNVKFVDVIIATKD